MTTEYKIMETPENSAEVGIAVHPLVRLLAWIEKDPDRRRLERIGEQVWLRDGLIASCVYAPGFEEIIAPTHSDGEPLFEANDQAEASPLQETKTNIGK